MGASALTRKALEIQTRAHSERKTALFEGSTLMVPVSQTSSLELCSQTLATNSDRTKSGACAFTKARQTQTSQTPPLCISAV